MLSMVSLVNILFGSSKQACTAAWETTVVGCGLDTDD
jgi:hypothetical protein